MNGILNQKEIDYVLFHLNLSVDISPVQEFFVFQEEHTPVGELNNKIIFKLTTKVLQQTEIQVIRSVPFLFPCTSNKCYEIDERSNLIFHIDILKAAFYLLSGYDRHFVNTKRDPWGRVSFKTSIQNKLNIIDRPVVNEYFEIILDALNQFQELHNRTILGRKNPFGNFGFLLSHDIDVIDKYTWPHLGFRIKELCGLTPTKLPKRRLLSATFKAALGYLGLKKNNPYWNFPYLTTQERNHGIKASYYFLPKEEGGGSAYNMDEPRLIELYKQLTDEGHEVGIHGTVKSVTSPKVLHENIRTLEEVIEDKVTGIRQHRLCLKIPDTFHYHVQNDLIYDTSFGFAEHEGFRNSYCLPFKPYDFQKKQMIDLWELPLNVMDVTLFHYRELTARQAVESVRRLVNEVARHGGIFTLLWHNSFFDDDLYPNVTRCYEEILQFITEKNPECLTGKEVAEIMISEEQASQM